MTVGELERALLALFPAEDAEDWDRTGLLAGDPGAEVTGVAIALDPTIAAMRAALAAGANVLLTHHPVHLDPPEGFLPAESVGETPASRIHFALSNQLNLINFHTALDASEAGLAALPKLLRLEGLRPLEPLREGSNKGFGLVSEPDSDERLSLGELAARCVATLGHHPRVWGDDATVLSSIAVCGGSAGSFLASCREQGIDCLVCGELKYHDALDAACSGLSIIELGHDVSENPLCAVLASACLHVGVPELCITMVRGLPTWHTPEAIRR
jgi:putative NIF3 family GTP cyclohydrolase 1 type 2